jgi:hypothetical protein
MLLTKCRTSHYIQMLWFGSKNSFIGVIRGDESVWRAGGSATLTLLRSSPCLRVSRVNQLLRSLEDPPEHLLTQFASISVLH